MLILVCPSCHREVAEVEATWEFKKVVCSVCGTEFVDVDGLYSSVKFKDHHQGEDVERLFDEALQDFSKLGAIMVPAVLARVVTRSAFIGPTVDPEKLTPMVVSAAKEAMVSLSSGLVQWFRRSKDVDAKGSGNPN